MRSPHAFTLLAVLITTRTASALEQSTHAEITQRTCEAAGFQHDFCERVADEVYNTDHYEFLTLAAHAQPEAGQSACDGASASMQRLLELGRETRAWLREVAAQPTNHDLSANVARAMGRALHTIEDNCAHDGMPNAQHAWHSLMDSCQGTAQSPDIQGSALACAESEAATMFQYLALAAADLGVDRAWMVPYEDWRHWPPRDQVCAFLNEAPNWDGIDRRWNTDIAVPAFRNQLAAALTDDGAWLHDICAGGEALARPNRDFDTDVSAGASYCTSVNLYCVGAGFTTGSGESPPPWEHDHAYGEAEGGCAAGTGSASLVWLLGALGLLCRRSKRAIPTADRESA